MKRINESDPRVQQVREKFQSGLAGLSINQRKVLRERYGLSLSKKCKSLEEVGKILGVTRERVRQIEEKALLIIGVK